MAEAVLELVSSSGRRRIPLDEFFLGRRSTARRPTELLVGITARPVLPGTGEVYLKLGRRSAMEVAIVGLAARLTINPDDTVAKARVAVCSVAPRPYRAVEVEEMLEGNRPEPRVVADAGGVLAAGASPIDDARASADYRLRVLPRLLARAVDECVNRARSGRTSQ